MWLIGQREREGEKEVADRSEGEGGEGGEGARGGREGGE